MDISNYCTEIQILRGLLLIWGDVGWGLKQNGIKLFTFKTSYMTLNYKRRNLTRMQVHSRGGRQGGDLPCNPWWLRGRPHQVSETTTGLYLVYTTPSRLRDDYGDHNSMQWKGKGGANRTRKKEWDTRGYNMQVQHTFIFWGQGCAQKTKQIH